MQYRRKNQRLGPTHRGLRLSPFMADPTVGDSDSVRRRCPSWPASAKPPLTHNFCLFAHRYSRYTIPQLRGPGDSPLPLHTNTAFVRLAVCTRMSDVGERVPALAWVLRMLITTGLLASRLLESCACRSRKSRNGIPTERTLQDDIKRIQPFIVVIITIIMNSSSSSSSSGGGIITIIIITIITSTRTIEENGQKLLGTPLAAMALVYGGKGRTDHLSIRSFRSCDFRRDLGAGGHLIFIAHGGGPVDAVAAIAAVSNRTDLHGRRMDGRSLNARSAGNLSASNIWWLRRCTVML